MVPKLIIICVSYCILIFIWVTKVKYLPVWVIMRVGGNAHVRKKVRNVTQIIEGQGLVA
jgi:hypothetical protein